MSKLDDAIEQYKTDLEEIDTDIMMSDSWKNEEREAARRLIKKSVKVLIEEIITEETAKPYDHTEAQDAIDDLGEILERRFRQL